MFSYNILCTYKRRKQFSKTMNPKKYYQKNKLQKVYTKICDLRFPQI